VLLVGLRALFSNDQETRLDGSGSHEGLARSDEYRAGAAVFPWKGGLLDVGVAVLDRHNALEQTRSLKAAPTVGAQQALVARHLWLRAGLDEATWTAGISVASAPFKLDLAVLRNLGVDRTANIFGKQNVGAFATLTFEYLEREGRCAHRAFVQRSAMRNESQRP